MPVISSALLLRTTRRLQLAAPLCVAAVLGACGPGAVATGPLPRYAEFAGREVREVRFAGELRVPEDSLRAVTVTRPTRCTLPILPRALCPRPLRDRYLLDLNELIRDAARLQLYHRDHGFYGSRILPSIDPLARDQVSVRFAIVAGDQVILRELAIEGAEDVIPTGALLRQIPLRVDEPFRRIAFLASADTVRGELFRRGHAFADVLRNYSIDTGANIAEVQYIAIPGPLVSVDTILVVGANRLGPRTVRRQMTFREMDLLRMTELNRSQRRLYSLGMVNFAAVEMAPDTLQLTPADSSSATVLVRVVEAPQYLVDSSAGYGTVDCFRTGVSWTNRNFLGGARRLELSGNVSKLGVGWPASWGLEDNVCGALSGDEFSDTLNYRLAADFQQPSLFGTQNTLAVGLRGQRISELDAYMRRVVGGQVAISRDLRLHTLLTTTANVEWGLTRAAPAVFCIGFDICLPEDWEPLQRPRWSNSLTFDVLRDRTLTEGFATRGYALRGGLGWASPYLGSDDDYLRFTGEATGTQIVRPGWVLAGRLHSGTFLRGTLDPRGEFIPPDRRFYAGGPNSVRGYGRNALGPVVYVTTDAAVPLDDAGEPELPEDFTAPSSPTGGTAMIVASVELRTPSPVLREFTRLGFFVDAGQVWAPGTDLATAPIRLTPGLGLRFATPVGPVRVDAAYNPYGREAGPLYMIETATGALTLLDPEFRPRDRGFWNRFQIHFAVGQAF